MTNDEKMGHSLDYIEELLGDAVGFLVDPDAEIDVDCEVLFSEKVAGFHYGGRKLTHSLTKLVRTAASESLGSESVILTCLVTDERRVHFSVVSPIGSFKGIGQEEILKQLNADDDADGAIRVTPNTPFWRGGQVDEETVFQMETLPLGGTRATLVIPEARVAWRDEERQT